ncbi:MAG TPA: oligoendopeptidase F, partial [Rhizobiales bacterium]|nr:oligoendopeptidase F [Hyphomicrobiales bacterium]
MINFNSRTYSGGESEAAEDMVQIGELPEWNLDDLYKSPEDEQLEADLIEAESRVQALVKSCKGRLAELAGERGALAAAIREYEALSDLLGKAGSYSGLLYA